MTSSYTCSLISPGVLSIDNNWDLHPFIPLTEPVLQSKESIAKVGLLHLPLVRRTADRRYQVITGKRSISFLCSSEPVSDIYCRVLSDSVSDTDLLALLHEEYAGSRPLSAMEQAYFFQLCRQHLDTSEQYALYATLGLQAKPHFIDRTLELLSLELPLQAGLMEGTISESLARELLKLDASDRTGIYALFLQLNIGGGKQKRIFSLLRDLAGRQGITIKEYMELEDFQAILSHREMNIPQKTQALLQLLQQRHTPSLADAEERFNTWKTALGLPDNCSIVHSQAFEQDNVTFSAEFGTRDEFEKWWDVIRPYMR